MYVYYVLICVGILLAISLVLLTVFVIKNVVINNKLENTYANPKTDWNHIKDFSDINSKKEGKVNSFKEDLDEDVRTVGLDFGDFAGEKDKKSSPDDEKIVPKKKVEEEFVNEYQTVSIDEMNSIDEINDSNDILDIEKDLNSILDIEKDLSSSNIDEIDNESATVSMEDYSDETVSMDSDETMGMEGIDVEEEIKLKVMLKYKDASGIKIQRMEKSKITVGRGIGNDLLFRSDSFTSRNHAVFTIKDNELYLEDLNSKNGTFIDKKKIKGEIKIEDSCEVTFGDITVDVIIEK